MSFLVYNVNIFGPGTKYCLKYSNSISYFDNTEWKIYSRFTYSKTIWFVAKFLPNGWHSAFRWCVVVTKIYCDLIGYLDHTEMFKSMLQFGFFMFFFFIIITWWLALMLSLLVNVKDCNICSYVVSTVARFELSRLKKVVCYYSSVFGFNKQLTNMCKLNILVHLKYKWLNVL